MATIAVKRYLSTQASAPALTGQAGALTALLNAILVTGFNTRNVTSLTRSGTTATCAASGHGYEADDVIAISGVNESGWNGEWRVATAATNSFTFTVPDTLTTPATGTIEAKRAPAGWSSPYSDTNRMVFRIPVVGGTGMYLDVDDNGPNVTNGYKSARLRGYESMTAVGVGTDPFPTSAQQSFGMPLIKSYTANSTSRPWAAYCDNRIIYLFCAYRHDYQPKGFELSIFGDIESAKPGDAYNAICSGAYLETISANPGAYNNNDRLSSYTSTSDGKYICRSHVIVDKSILFGIIGTPISGASSMGISGFAFPSPVDNGLWYSQTWLAHNSLVRGKMPGFMHPLHNNPYENWILVDNLPDFPGKKFMSQSIATGASAFGQCLIDITGPWR